MSEEKNAIVIYSSMYKQFIRLMKRNTDAAFEYITAILEYGFEGIEPDEDSDVMLYGFEADKIALDNASVRYLKAQENGAKGGRPSKCPPYEELLQKYDELKTWAAVAKYYGVSDRTLQRWRGHDKTRQNQTKLSDKTVGQMSGHDKTRQNLEKEIEIDKEKELTTERIAYLKSRFLEDGADLEQDRYWLSDDKQKAFNELIEMGFNSKEANYVIDRILKI